MNLTYAVGSPPVAAVQRLNTKIFEPEIHFNIDVVTRHIEAYGIATPRLIPTASGQLWADDEGGCWRASSWIQGESIDAVHDHAVAHEAGRLVGRWHRAVADLEWDVRAPRVGVHDTDRHMRLLANVEPEYPGHLALPEFQRLANDILERWARWGGEMEFATRNTHGDLKISNIRFAPSGVALALVDLDTVGKQPIEMELADAMRSWCNPLGENAEDTGFDVGLFAAALGGWRSECPGGTNALLGVPETLERVALELAARFSIDALEERYFRWDPSVAPSASAHNLIRARGQLSLARSIAEQRRLLDAAVASA